MSLSARERGWTVYTFDDAKPELFGHLINVPKDANTVVFLVRLRKKQEGHWGNVGAGFRIRHVKDGGPPTEWGNRHMVTFFDGNELEEISEIIPLTGLGIRPGETYHFGWFIESFVNQMGMMTFDQIRVEFA